MSQVIMPEVLQQWFPINTITVHIIAASIMDILDFEDIYLEGFRWTSLIWCNIGVCFKLQFLLDKSNYSGTIDDNIQVQ